MRIAVVTSIPTPYRDPFWGVFAGRDDIDLEVIYCSPGKGDRPWDRAWKQDYKAHYPKGYNLAKWFGADASCYWNPELTRILAAGNFDGIIIGGYNHITMLRAMWFAVSNKIPYFFQSEVYIAQPRSQWRIWVKHFLVKWVINNASGYLPTGKLSSEYLAHYGAAQDRMSQLPNVPDVEHFYRTAVELGEKKEQVKATKGLSGKYIVLFVSRLIRLKRVDLLIRAFARARSDDNSVLVILGDGPMRKEWETLAEELKVSEAVRFEGFLNPQDLPEWYSIADLSALTSTDETWSVVVLEALASRVPVVITDMVGCYANAINDPVVGDVVKAGDVDDLTEALRNRMDRPTNHEAVAEAWAPVREAFRYEVVAARTAAFLTRFCGNAEK